jgi:hypothetical protein
MREYFDEARQGLGPVIENPRGAAAAGEFEMTLSEVFHGLDVLRFD